MFIEDYLINKSDSKIILVVEDNLNNNIKDFDFMNSNLYIKNSTIKNRVIFVINKNNKKTIEIINMDTEDIKDIHRLKKLTIAIVDLKGKILKGFELDVKLIK